LSTFWVSRVERAWRWVGGTKNEIVKASGKEGANKGRVQKKKERLDLHPK